jgi:hypothetical protein
MTKNRPAVASAPPKPPTRAATNRVLLTVALLDEERSKRPHQQKVIWDAKTDGLCVLISRGPRHKRQATVTFRVVYYLKDRPGEPRYIKLGRYPDERSDLAAVRREAMQIRIDAKEGIDPRKPKLTGTFAETVARFIDDHASENRRGMETKRIFARYVIPQWADQNIETITRDAVSDLLSRIRHGRIEFDGQKHGTLSVARATRAAMVTLFNWYEAKHTVGKDYRNPIPKLLKSDPLKTAPVRERHLDDDEIKALWLACGELGTYGAAVKAALLTAQRFNKVLRMRRADLKDQLRINGESVPHIWDPTRTDDPKNKGVSVVPLSAMARRVIAAVPIIDADDDTDFVFSTNGHAPLIGVSKPKRTLDQKMLALLRRWAQARGEDPNQVELKPWQHRDLRRTARTLMARAKVPAEVAEHCLAHVPPGIVAVYNRHGYLPEKREAFEKLATLVASIANPAPPANVVAIGGGRRRRAR